MLRPMSRAELPLLARWLAEPHVARWWREPADLGRVTATYGPALDGDDPTELLIAELDGEPIGMVQRYLLADNVDYRTALERAGARGDAASIDYLVGTPSLTGLGLGPEMIRLVTEETWAANPHVPQIAVAVQQENRRSWRALEKAGYRRIWSGIVDSGDPSDDGPSFVYARDRPPARS
jgi:aminoglycoside 6'-N-acetyltransferase